MTAQGVVYFKVRYRREGQQRALSFFGDTEEEALSDANEFAGLVNSLGSDKAVQWWNAHLDPNEHEPTLDAWFARYLTSITGVTAGTLVTYERTYNRVWHDALGGLPLSAIGREDIARVINELSKSKSDKTVRNAYGILATSLKVALEDGLLPALPTRGIRLPRRTEHESTEMRFLDHDEWEKLAKVLPAHYVPLFTFLVGTGARWGEAEALLVGDVDLDAGVTLADDTFESRPVVRVSKAAKWNASKATREIGPTKTRRSKRTITLPPEVVDALAPLVDGRAKRERLFLAPKGGPLRHRTVYDSWKKAVEKAGFDPQPRMHDLRHTHVSWLIARGVPLTVIQRRLGHEHINTTSDTYGHLLPELDVAAAAAASVAMRPREVKGKAPKELPPGH